METLNLVRERMRSAPIQGMFLSDAERSSLDFELRALLNAICVIPSIDRANAKLLELGLMQDALATLSFKYKVRLSRFQSAFVREYDRWDDTGERSRIFNAMRNGCFLSTYKVGASEQDVPEEGA